MIKRPGPGGTEGGMTLFIVGSILSALGMYFFFHSINVTTDHVGIISGAIGRGGGMGGMYTTSMGIIFVPFIIGVIALFYDVKRTWGWWMLYLGIAVIAIDVLSRIRFQMRINLAHLLIMMVLFSAGIGLILRSYRERREAAKED